MSLVRTEAPSLRPIHPSAPCTPPALPPPASTRGRTGQQVVRLGAMRGRHIRPPPRRGAAAAQRRRLAVTSPAWPDLRPSSRAAPRGAVTKARGAPRPEIGPGRHQGLWQGTGFPSAARSPLPASPERPAASEGRPESPAEQARPRWPGPRRTETVRDAPRRPAREAGASGGAARRPGLGRWPRGGGNCGRRGGGSPEYERPRPPCPHPLARHPAGPRALWSSPIGLHHESLGVLYCTRRARRQRRPAAGCSRGVGAGRQAAGRGRLLGGAAGPARGAARGGKGGAGGI
jgi:hypothetical protein